MRINFYHLCERIYGLFTGRKPRRRCFNFEVHLIDACNLNCKGCFHFAPLAKNDNVYPLEEFEKEIKRLSALFKGNFGWIHLLGGEPLLNKDIIRYLDIIGNNVRKGQVDLVSNGLLLPKMDDSFFEACKRNRVRIAVTKYPVQGDYGEIEETVKSHGCEFAFFDDKMQEGTFCSMSLDPNSSASYKKRYFACPLSNACVSLHHGRLYYCTAPTYVYLYNDAFGQTFDNSADSISIFDHDKKEILDFLRTPRPFSRYCDVHYRDANPVPWGNSKKEKDEWLKKGVE